MKKSKLVSLVLITAALASCNKKESQSSGASGDWGDAKEKKVYMRSDSTATYTRTHHHSGFGTGLLLYYAFRPYGSYNNGFGYNRAGYYSGNLHSKSNVGTSVAKSNIVRGGFGGGSSRASGSRVGA
jgi:hypothetical protein